jgi:hypothetical protein
MLRRSSRKEGKVQKTLLFLPVNFSFFVPPCIGNTRKFLCSWEDGAPPQWLDYDAIKDTIAFEEWEEKEEELPEEIESKEETERKCKILLEVRKCSIMDSVFLFQ